MTGTDEGTASRRVRLRLGALAVLVAAFVAVALVVGVPDPQQVRDGVADLGPTAAPAFFVLYAATCLLPLPRTVMSLASGLLFGLPTGLALALAGAVLGGVASFALSRALGREAVERFTGTRVARVDHLLARRGLLAVLVVRLVPLIPFMPVSYAAGLSAVRLRDFALGTLLGSAPGTLAAVTLGAYGANPGSWPFLAALGALLALTAGSAWLTRRRRRDD